MAVTAHNVSAATTTFRVGDVIRADVTLDTFTSVQFNAVQVAMDFDASELVPVTDATGRVAIAPTTATENRDSAVFHIASGTFGSGGTILRNTYTVVGTGSASGQVRLDAGVELPTAGGASVPITLDPERQAVIGSLYLRVRNNPSTDTTNLGLTLRDSAATDNRFGLVAMVDADGGGYNILGPVSGATLAVSRTTVGARLVVATPAAGTVRRIGDVVPVRLALDATTTARNARTITAEISYQASSLGLVAAATGSNGAPPPFVASGTFAPDVTGSVLGASAVNHSTHTLDAATGAIVLNVDGAPLAIAANSSDVTVATLYFRLLDRGSLALSLGNVQIGDLSIDVVPPPSTLAFPIAVSSASSATIPDVRGSVGVEVAAVGSPRAQSDGTPVALDFASMATGTFTVTDGRFLDIELRALAGASDAQAVSRVAIDVTLPAGLTLATGSNQLLAPGIVSDSTNAAEPAVTATTGVATSTLSVRVRVGDGAARLQASSPVVRVRLAVATSTFTTTTSTLPLEIAATTSLTQTGTRFANNLHDAAADPALATLDLLPTITRQKPASFAVPLRLQGRTTADPASRFTQPVGVFLALPGTTVPATRRATIATPAALATTATGTMRYQALSVAAPSGTDTRNATSTLPDLDPGTYDLFVKGRSSLTGRVGQVTLQPGASNDGALVGPVTLLEGDADRNDSINIGDFVLLATTYATPAPTDPAVDTADFNQSGYVDAFDFSLLARNYAVRGPITVATIGSDAPLPTHLATHEASSATFAITIPSNEKLSRARISVTADPRLGLACAATSPTGTTCTADGPSRLTLATATVGGVSGVTPITVGSIALDPNTAGTANLTAVLIEATGIDAAGQPTTYRAPSVTSTIVVDPDVTFTLAVTPGEGNTPPAGLDATVSFDIATGVKVTGGTVSLAFDATRLAVAEHGCTAPDGATCTSSSGGVTFTIAAVDGLPQGASFGPVRLVPVSNAPTGSSAIHASVTNLVDAASDPIHLPRALTSPPSGPGKDLATAIIEAADDGATVATVSASRTRAASVRARTARPVTGVWLSGPDHPVAPGSIVPVEVRLAAGLPIDAAQVVLRVGDGYQIVDASGRPAGRDTVIAEATASPLPILLRQAIDGATGLIELAFGRQAGQGTGGATGEGRLGTILVKIPDASGVGTGPALTIVPTGGGAFTSVVVGPDGNPGNVTGASVWVDSDPLAAVGEAIDVGPVVGPVDPIIGPAAPSGAIDSGTGAARVPTAVSSRATAPNRAASASVAPASRATGRPLGLVEDRARGTVAVSVPGRPQPVQLKTGFATTVADDYCPVARHQTYIRLQDVGIAGATFGVEPGGVLAWVTPDQAGCVDWAAIDAGGLTFTKETIMQFRLARAMPSALLWVLDGARSGELYEVDAAGTATYVTAAAFAANHDHFTAAWANVIPVSTAQLDGLATQGAVLR